MICPACHHPKVRVVDSRDAHAWLEQGRVQAVRRRRACRKCDFRWSTVEIATTDFRLAEDLAARRNGGRQTST